MSTIRQAISVLPLHAIHKIGTGDYHYVSLFWLERVYEDFVLYLFDNHPDDQPGAFGEDMLTCGSWVKEVRRLPSCKGIVWCDGNGIEHREGLISEKHKAYLSIDLDILSSKYASTDWDQGDMTLEEIQKRIMNIRRNHEIIGVDLCGGLTPEKGASPADIALNAATEEALINLFAD